MKKSNTLLFMGPGGVGKTTLSFVASVYLCQLGYKVALLSIDPAKRLASALSLDLAKGELTRVPMMGEGYGELWAGMIDQKSIFDAMVRQYSPTPKIRDAILSHPLYETSATEIAGPLEYLALAKLEDLVQKQEYDFIILDTPPDAHALDFLDRPHILQNFMDQGVMTWFIKPLALAQKMGLSKVIHSTNKWLASVSQVTGVEAIQKVAEFLSLMHTVIEGFNQIAKKMTGILAESQYVIVSNAEPFRVRTASFIIDELNKKKYPIKHVIINRAIPDTVKVAVTKRAKRAEESNRPLDKAFSELMGKINEEQWAKNAIEKKTQVAVQFIPDSPMIIESLEGLIMLSKHFEPIFRDLRPHRV